MMQNTPTKTPSKKKFIIPLYLRWYQKEFVKNFKDKKRALLIYHRRAGKDLLCWTYLIKRAFYEKGNYFYIYPEYSQARKALWDAITEDGRSYLDFVPRKMITRVWKHEMKIKLASGSLIQLLGSDNFDSIRGTNPRGVVLSEYAYQNPLVWTLILDPILTKNKGWAIFNSTPNGKNHFYDLYLHAKESENWYVKKLTIEDTQLISLKEIEDKKGQGISEEFIQQEYYCSFDIGVQGSYYGKQVRKMQEEGRIGHVPYDKNLLVYTAWDLGFSDAMSIIFFQKRGNEILIIDFYENHGYQLAHYLDHLRSKEYAYGKHFVPFDAKSHDRAGNTFTQIAKQQGFDLTVLSQQRSILEGIEKVRGAFPRIFIDKTNCDYLIRCLLEYHADFDEKTHVYKNVPKHNWASHACFIGSTPLLTRNGLRPIMDVKKGDEVWTLKGWKKVKLGTKTGINVPIVEVTFNDSTKVKCTPDHMFLTEKGWKSAVQLTPYLELQSSLTKLLSILMVVYINYIRKANITAGEVKNYTERFGEWLSEKFHQIATFIIEMETNQITALQIWNALIKVNTQDWLIKKIHPLFQSLLEKKQNYGMQVKQEDYGIKDMLSVLKDGLNGKEKTGIALFVEKNLKHLLESLEKHKNIATLIAKPLHIVEVKKINKREDVYCLFESDTNSFSLYNGIIVHNCDGLRYMTQSLDQLTSTSMSKEHLDDLKRKAGYRLY